MTDHEQLAQPAARQRPGEHGLPAHHGHSGNRSVLVDHELMHGADAVAVPAAGNSGGSPA